MDGVERPLESETDRAGRLAREAEMIAEAEAELARGEFIPWDEIEAWIESWDTPGELPMPQPRRAA